MSENPLIPLIKRFRLKLLERVKENKEELWSYCMSDTATIHIFQMELFSNIVNNHDTIDLADDTVQNIITDRTVLELFMTSGGVEDGNWKKALQILTEIFRQDPQAQHDKTRLKLAVAVALTFAMPVISYAYRADNMEIDAIMRYQSYVKWAVKSEGIARNDDELFDVFYEWSAWHLRYVVGSWAQDQELVWARENVLPEFKHPDKIGGVTHEMIKYREYNDEGISIHDGPPFYNHRPETLALLHELGGVCGTVSKFAAAMCQAFGVPAMPVGQPGHCAYVWCTKEGWVLGNGVSSWNESTYHDGIQADWARHAPFVKLMHDAQMGENFQISEKLRIAAKLMDPKDHFGFLFSCVLPCCPENYSTWQDVLDLAKNMDLIGSKFTNVAEGKPVTVSATPERANNVTEDSGSEWWSSDETAWIEIDLLQTCTVDNMKIQWWGYSKANQYKVYAIGVNGKQILVKTEKDQTIDAKELGNDCNQWINITGWAMGTRKVRIELYDGNKDPWDMNMLFGLRQVAIFGCELDDSVNVARPRWKSVLEGITEEPASLENSLPVLIEEFNKLHIFGGVVNKSYFNGATVSDVLKICRRHDKKAVEASKESCGVEELLNSSSPVIWESRALQSWIEVDLGNICYLNSIVIDWVEGRAANGVKVSIKCGADYENEVQDLCELNEVGKNVRLDFVGANVAIQSIQIIGMEYTYGRIIQGKIKRLLKKHPFVANKLIEEYK